METCVRCGARFGCGRTEKKKTCWCAELPLVMPVPKEGNECLCPDCLKAEIVARTRHTAPGSAS